MSWHTTPQYDDKWYAYVHVDVWLHTLMSSHSFFMTKRYGTVMQYMSTSFWSTYLHIVSDLLSIKYLFSHNKNNWSTSFNFDIVSQGAVSFRTLWVYENKTADKMPPPASWIRDHGRDGVWPIPWWWRGKAEMTIHSSRCRQSPCGMSSRHRQKTCHGQCLPLARGQDWNPSDNGVMRMRVRTRNLSGLGISSGRGRLQFRSRWKWVSLAIKLVLQCTCGAPGGAPVVQRWCDSSAAVP